MKNKSFLTLALVTFFIINKSVAQENDTLAIYYFGHASLMFVYQDIVIHVDPRSSMTNYSKLPDADYIFVTHEHGDHYETSALNTVTKSSTILVTTETVKNKGGYDGNIEVMANGDSKEYGGINVEAVPAYNFTAAFHPKGVGNGYVFTFGKTRVYVAGDTEDIPEMDSIEAEVAFLPMNQPYTMTEEQASHAAVMVNPDVLYIYHNGGSDNNKLKDLMKDHDNIEVRIDASVYFMKTSTGESWKYVEENPTKIENRALNDVNIFPNPVTNELYVNNLVGSYDLVIMNLEGKVMQKVKSRHSSHKIDIQSFPQGNYILKVLQDNDEKTFGFMKI